ncbi:hypothetical protein Taro_009461 [Colocasia esculenta]|uniref:Uncharacterized protein n=1 Tax=Colocasia esculenta TaxID=4460 RepID=A0A843U4T2_COLES|nr:hypothetical protein [Colocasia esculenta]
MMKVLCVCSTSYPHPSRLPSSSSSSSSPTQSSRADLSSFLYSSHGVHFGNVWRRSRSSGLDSSANFVGQRFRVFAKGANGAPFAPGSTGTDGSKLNVVSGSAGKLKLEPFGGKSGSISFCGLTYDTLEERQLVSAPFKEGTGSFLWILGPLAFISSLLLPQIFLSSFVEATIKDDILAEIVASIFSETIFYIGLATFLRVAEQVQRPYLEFSAKRWSLITGLRGYLSSVFFTMGLKVFVPLLAVYATWPVIGLPALVSVAPFLIGCGVQFMFESALTRRGSSCWPLLPIIFEVYRLYQLSKGAHFVQNLMFSLRRSAVSPELLDQSGAFMSMFAVFQVLGIVCLWSLMTFLIRLFPSRPVAENY